MTLVSASEAASAGELAWARGEGADACPDAAAFASRLSDALEQPAREALGSRSLEATVAREGDAWLVSLWWRGAHGATSAHRTLRVAEPSCEPAVEAAVSSVVVALRTGALPDNDNVVVSIAPAPAPLVRPAAAPVAPALAHAVYDGPRLGDASLAFVSATGWLPQTTVGLQLVVEPLVWRRLRLVATVTGLAEQTVTTGSSLVGLSAVTFGFAGCGTVLAAGRWFQGSLCAGFDGGTTQVFSYSGVALINGINGGGSGFAPGVFGSLFARTNPVGPVVFGLELGLRAPLLRYNIGLSSGDRVVQPPAAFVLGLRVGITLPGGP